MKCDKKKLARDKLRYYINKGTYVRPKICSKCEKEGKIEPHHLDYDNWNNFIWLCRDCHIKEHNGFNNNPNTKLTPKTALEVFNAKGTYRYITSKYNIGCGQVSRIKNKQNWKNIHN